MVLWSWKLGLPSGHFGLLISMNQQAKQVITVPIVVIDPDYQGEIRFLLHNGDKGEYVWIVGGLPKCSYNSHVLRFMARKNLPLRGGSRNEGLGRKLRNTWNNRQIWPWNTEWSRAKTNRVLSRECTGHSKHLLSSKIFSQEYENLQSDIWEKIKNHS